MSELDDSTIEKDLTPKRVAFIIDGKVVDVLQTDERLAAIFLSQPEILDVTEGFENSVISSGSSFDEELERFVPEKPFPSFVFDDESKSWKPPLPFPSDYTEEGDFYYSWNEEIVNWEQLPKPSIDQE